MSDVPPVWYNCLSREVFTPEKQAWCDRWKRLQTAMLVVPTTLDPQPEYITVTLNQGRYQQEDGQFIVELANQQGWLAFGDINQDGKEDAAVIFGVALDPNGRTIATYLTAVLDIDGEARALTPVKLGDRILLNGPIKVQNSRITVPFLTQTEAFDRTFAINDTALIEITGGRC